MSAEKIGAIHIDADTAEKLFKSGLISNETYKKVSKHFAAGGEVQPTNEPVAQPEATAQTPIEELLSGAGANPATQPAMTSLPPNQMAALPENAGLNWDTPLPTAVKSQDLSPAPSSWTPPPVDPSSPSELALAQNSPASAAQDPMQQAQAQIMGQVAAKYDRAFGDMTKSAQAGAAAGARQAAEESAYYKEQEKQLGEMRQQQIEGEDLKQSHLTAENNKIAQLKDDYLNKASIDPNRFWKDKSTLQKIGIAIGIALSGVNGKGNAGMEIINNAINRDIDAQKANLGKAREGVELENNVYANMLKQYGDARLADNATRQITMAMMASRIQAIQAKYKGPAAAAGAAQLLFQVRLKEAEYQQQFAQNVLTSPAFMQQNAIRTKINMLPKDDQPEAKKEWQEYQDLQNRMRVADKHFQTMYDNRGLTRHIPFTDARSKYDTAEALFNTNIHDIFGRTAPYEIDLIAPLKPRWNDDKQMLQYKKNAMHEKYGSMVSSSFPTLRDHNILPTMKHFNPTE